MFSPAYYRFLLPVMLLSALLGTSCGHRPDLKYGLKLTLALEPKEAIAGLAGHPDDPYFKRALDSAFAQPAPNEQSIRNFIAYYKAIQPGKTAANFFYSGDEKGFDTDEALKAFLSAAVHNEIKKMDRVLKLRIHAFCNTDTFLIRIENPAANQLVLYVPGIKGKEELNPVFAHRNGLHFWATADLQQVAPYLVRCNDTLKKKLYGDKPKEPVPDQKGEPSLQEMVDKKGQADRESAPLFSLLQPNVDMQGNLLPGATIGTVAIKDTAKVSELFGYPECKALLPPSIKFFWGQHLSKELRNKAVALYAIVVPAGGKAPVGDDDIANARGDYQNGKTEISLEMGPLGTQKWSRLTRDNINKAIAIELDNYIYSAPNVNEEIKGGRSSITGDFTVAEMDDLVKVLNSGSFPLPFLISGIETYGQ